MTIWQHAAELPEEKPIKSVRIEPFDDAQESLVEMLARKIKGFDRLSPNGAH